MSAKRDRNKKAGKRTLTTRVEEVVKIRLDGAEFWDVREYVREKEKDPESAWALKPGEGPLCDDSIRRYCRKADAVIEASTRVRRVKLFARHVAKRNNLYASAKLAGDYRTALATLSDLDRLLGMYPAKELKIRRDGGKGGCAASLSDEELERIARGETDGKPGRGRKRDPETPKGEERAFGFHAIHDGRLQRELAPPSDLPESDATGTGGDPPVNAVHAAPAWKKRVGIKATASLPTGEQSPE